MIDLKQKNKKKSKLKKNRRRHDALLSNIIASAVFKDKTPQWKQLIIQRFFHLLYHVIIVSKWKPHVSLQHCIPFLMPGKTDYSTVTLEWFSVWKEHLERFNFFLLMKYWVTKENAERQINMDLKWKSQGKWQCSSVALYDPVEAFTRISDMITMSAWTESETKQSYRELLLWGRKGWRN